MTEIPEIYLDLLLEQKALAHLVTVMPDRSPQCTPVWFDYVDGKIRVNSAHGQVKTRNMKEGAKMRCPSWTRAMAIATYNCAAP